MTKLVTVGDYQDSKRELLCWDQEETTSIIYQISKKFLEHDPEIKIGSDYTLRKEPNGINLESIKTKLHKAVDFTKQYKSGTSSYGMSVNLVALKVWDGGSTEDSYMAIKLNLGTSRSTRLEKRITPKSVEKLDGIVKLFVEELSKRLKEQEEYFITSQKEYETNLEHSKTFPDFAEKLGFGRDKSPQVTTEWNHWGIGNYSSIKKDFGETNIHLGQRVDGDFDIHISKIDEEKLKKLLGGLTNGV